MRALPNAVFALVALCVTLHSASALVVETTQVLVDGLAVPRVIVKQDALFEYYCTGTCPPARNDTDPLGRVGSSKGKGGTVLMGGGTDVDEAFNWMGIQSAGAGLLVLRTGPKGDDAYDEYIYKLGGHAYVATLILLQRNASFLDFTAAALVNCSAVFLAGGDQSTYWRQWVGTPVQLGIQECVSRGCPVGGTSAGEAMLSGIVNAALAVESPDSQEALQNPFAPDITLRPRFLQLPYTALTVNDMHFAQRDRNGRLLAFMARTARRDMTMLEMAATGYPTVYGVGVDEKTALLVNWDTGSASIVGSGSAYMLRLDGDTPRECVEDEPLSIDRLTAYRLDAATGGSFDFSSWNGTGGVSYSYGLVRGQYVGTPYGPQRHLVGERATVV